MTQKNRGAHFRFARLNVINVARHIDVRGARFDAGSAQERVVVVDIVCDGLGIQNLFRTEFKRPQKRSRRRLPDTAKARFLHLKRDRLHVFPIHLRGFASDGFFKRFGNHQYTDAARCAFAAGLARRALVVAPK